MPSLLRRAPFYYGRVPERLALSPSATIEWRSYVKLEPWSNAHLIADDFWEAPGVVVYIAPGVTGGAVASGLASMCRTWARVAAGGAVASGASANVRTWARVASGEAHAGGAAAASFTPYSSGYMPSGGVSIGNQPMMKCCGLFRAEHSIGTKQYRRRFYPWYRRRGRK